MMVPCPSLCSLGCERCGALGETAIAGIAGMMIEVPGTVLSGIECWQVFVACGYVMVSSAIPVWAIPACGIPPPIPAPANSKTSPC